MDFYFRKTITDLLTIIFYETIININGIIDTIYINYSSDINYNTLR